METLESILGVIYNLGNAVSLKQDHERQYHEAAYSQKYNNALIVRWNSLNEKKLILSEKWISMNSTQAHHPAAKKRCTGISTLCLNLLRHLGLHIGRHTDQVVHHLIAVLLAGVLDLLELDFGFFVGFAFGDLVSARVLQEQNVSTTFMLVWPSSCISPRPRTSCTPLPSASCNLLSPSGPLTWRLLSAWCGLYW